MMSFVPVFNAANQKYHADTCEPLKNAAAQGLLRLDACGRGAYPGQPLPPDTISEVASFGVWDADHDQSWGLDWHRNEGIELTYVARGKVAFGVDDQHVLLKHGALTITRPWQRHRVGAPNVSASCLHWLILDVGVRRPNQHWQWPEWLLLSAEDRAALTNLLSHNEQPVWQADADVARYFEKLGAVAAGYGGRGSDESHIKLAINGLLVGLLELLRRNKPVLDSSLSSAQRTVRLFLASLPDRAEQPWTLESMAAACGLARSRFTYYCKQITNMSPNEYLRRCRVTAAAELLRKHRNDSITDIALNCGFSSSQYFATVFHEYFGCSPREYREKQKTSLTIHRDVHVGAFAID